MATRGGALERFYQQQKKAGKTGKNALMPKKSTGKRGGRSRGRSSGT